MSQRDFPSWTRETGKRILTIPSPPPSDIGLGTNRRHMHYVHKSNYAMGYSVFGKVCEDPGGLKSSRPTFLWDVPLLIHN
jgi:hypothetical protein